MRPFLTFVTGAYRRPNMLARCVASVEEQDDPDWEHIVLVDEDDYGIDGFHARLGADQDRYRGRYIYVLPDDDMLIVPDFVSGLKRIYAGCAPDIVMAKADKLELGILPDAAYWGGMPALGHVDMLNYVVEAELWKTHSASFTKRDHPYYDGAFAGDFSFVWDLFQGEHSVYWWDRVVARSQRISRGAPE